MWLFDFNLPIYLSAELRQNGIHLIVEFSCAIIFMQLMIVYSCRTNRSLLLHRVGKFEAVR